MKNSDIIMRARFSVQGIGWAWRSERSLQDHVLISIAILAGLVWAGVEPFWIALVGLAVAVGWSMEIANAGFEKLCDKLHPAHDPAIGAAKDMASAAAFTVNMAIAVLAICALAIGR